MVGDYSHPIRDKKGTIVSALELVLPITERKKMEATLNRQRDIALALSGSRDLKKALNRLFDSLLEIEECDSAGFYLVDEETGALELIAHRGLSYAFVEKSVSL